MEKCKYCQEELEENSTVCPHCGKDNAAEEIPTEAAAEETTAVEETTAEEPAVEEPAAQEQDAPAVEATEEEKPAEIKEGKKATPGKIAIAVAVVVVLAAVLIALIVSGLSGDKAEGGTIAAETTEATAAETVETTASTVPADGEPGTVTEKGTYTVTDEDAIAEKDTVVATVDGVGLTNGQLQVYYWSIVNSYLNSDYGYTLMYYGLLDYTKPLDTQLCYEDNSLTWQQFFLKEALNYWQMNQALVWETENAGMEMAAEDQEYLDNLAASMQDTAAYYGFETVEDLLLNNIGPAAGMEEFTYFQRMYYAGRPYYEAETAKFVPAAEDLETYYTENEDYFATNGITKETKLVDARHILAMVESTGTDEEGNAITTDEDWAACEEKAQAILDEWLAGEKTEDSFAALANEKSEDGGSNTNGGLYEDIYEGQMVEPFESWCFDESRQYGDYGLVQTSYGYHVMFYVGSSPAWESYAESGWISQKGDALIARLAEDHPMEVDYSAIKLAYLNLG